MTASNFIQTMKDGTEISVNRWIPDGEVKGLIQIVHGNAEHAMRYDWLGTVFAEKGFAVSVHDHRGHGRTAQIAERKGTGMMGLISDKDGYLKVESDVIEIGEKFKADYPGKKICLLGHSFGSFVVQAAIEDHSELFDCCVLCGSAGPRPLLIKSAIMIATVYGAILGKKRRARLINDIAYAGYNSHYKPQRTEFDWLSRNQSNVDLYMSDKWCGFIQTASFFKDMFMILERIHKASNMKKIRKDLPVYIIYGSDDPVGDYGQSLMRLMDVYKKNGMESVEMKCWPDDRHEIFNETDKEAVAEDTLSWISRQLD